MYKVQIDTIDKEYTLQAAAAARLKAAIVQEDGPAGWPVVELEGNAADLEAYLLAGQYELDAHPLIKA